METGVSAGTAQRIGVPREIFPGEKRVATVPEVVEKLTKLGFKVAIESGAGDLANFSDDPTVPRAQRWSRVLPLCGQRPILCSRCAARAPKKLPCCAKAARLSALSGRHKIPN